MTPKMKIAAMLVCGQSLVPISQFVLNLSSLSIALATDAMLAVAYAWTVFRILRGGRWPAKGAVPRMTFRAAASSQSLLLGALALYSIAAIGVTRFLGSLHHQLRYDVSMSLAALICLGLIIRGVAFGVDDRLDHSVRPSAA
jgi:hypothetical protein